MRPAVRISSAFAQAPKPCGLWPGAVL